MRQKPPNDASPWDKIRYDGNLCHRFALGVMVENSGRVLPDSLLGVLVVRLRQPHKRTINSRSQRSSNAYHHDAHRALS